MSDTSSSQNRPGNVPAGHGGSSFQDQGVGLVTGADQGIASMDSLQHDLMARIEADLTDEVRGLILALSKFGGRAKAISELIPSEANGCKGVSLFLTLSSFQLAIALGQGLERGIFLNDGAEYFGQLELSGKDLFRQLDLDGRRFLAVAFGEQSLAERASSAERPNDGSDFHSVSNDERGA